MDSGASSSANPLLYITFRTGGRWVDLKSQPRRRYVGGCKKTVKLEPSRVTFDGLKKEVEDICSWQRGYQFELHVIVPGTSPKEYRQLNSSADFEDFVVDARHLGRVEIVVISPEINVEASINLPKPASCVDEVQQAASWDIDLDNTFTVGSRFSNAKAFKQALRSYSINVNYAVKITSSDHSRILAGCCFGGCPWRARAALCSDDKTFEIRTMGGTHTCPGINRSGNKQASTEWIAGEIKEMIRNQPLMQPKHLKANLECSHGLSLPYMKLWRSREQARELLFGSVDENFGYVPALRFELLHRNPGSVINYSVDSDTGAFQRFYVSFKVSIDGFLRGCRYLIGLDACHLKSKYLGVLLSANSLDGNSGLYTLAFAVVEGESKRSWTWFLHNLLDSLDFELFPLAFISDMEKGLLESIKVVFPNSEHRVCLRHLWKNMKKLFRCQDGQKLQSLVWTAANAYLQSEYQEKMVEIYNLAPEVYYYISSLPYLWSRSQFGIDIKNDANTNNVSESFNAWIGDARSKPAVDLINEIRGMLMELRATRLTNAASWRGEVVPFADQYLRAITTRKEHFLLRKSTAFRCEVRGTNGHFEVDTHLQECSCRYWQMTGLPCIHAVAFIASLGSNPQWHTYVDTSYRVERYLLAYEGAISTMPGKKEWQSFDEEEVGIPNTARPRGRPRTNRIKNFLEVNGGKSTNTHRCGRCGQRGHHRSTCKNPILGDQARRSKMDVRRGPADSSSEEAEM